MKTRNLVHYFLKTAFIGAIAGLVISFFVQAEVYMANLSPLHFMEIVGLIVFNLGLGLTFSVVSMTGFFAYLFIHRFGLNLFRSFWPTVQILLIAFVLFDLVYFPYQATKGEVSAFWYVLMALGLFAYAWFVAKMKVKLTNKKAFIPALFVMVVITTVEWVPGLQVEGTDYALLMIFPLLACNTYQLLALQNVTAGSKEKVDTKVESVISNKKKKR